MWNYEETVAKIAISADLFLEHFFAELEIFESFEIIFFPYIFC